MPLLCNAVLQIIASEIRKINKDIQIEKVKLCLSADYNCRCKKMIRKIKKRLLDLITQFSKATQYKVKVQKINYIST